MKATELMIGDWVRITEPDPHHGYIAQVQCIGGTNNYLTVYIPHQHNKDVFAEDVEPIPLTDEILEQNGFKYFHKNYASLSCKHPFKLRMVEWPDENGLNGLWTIYDLIEIRYVHQLQHALRLCGIEKEINIKQ